MSTIIDERVVSMQFDNEKFEKNVSTTMSTLDKLKQALRFDGATKGLTEINSAASNVNMSGLGSAVETVSTKFSALQVMGVTALANITNSAVNAGKRIVKALTIEPVTTGFNEYELKMGSIQTIMAGTGESLETVNKYLGELNEYSDKTIYSFKDMTSNIGKFTNAGVKLEDAVMAIKGISNEAAVSGANANEASRAMYNFSQALSAGYVKLIDWKSIENANMATKEFKEQLIQSAVAAGTLKKLSNGMYKVTKPVSKANAEVLNATKDFNDSLGNQWMTTEVLISTLRKYADENTAIGKKASAAATEVKTFSMMMDTLKESAQSGWAQTWELLVGDFNEAKDLFTKLSKFIGGIIDATSGFRNRILEIGLNFKEPWDDITKKLSKVTSITKKVAGATKTLKYFQDVVTKVWRGDYNNQGDNPDRRDLLKKAGYDARVVQELVNKGYKYKLTMKDVEAAHKKYGVTMKSTTTETKNLTKQLNDLSDKQLKSAGLTKSEIALYKALQKEADRLGISVDELAKDMSKNDGRSLLMKSFQNFGDIFVGIGKAAKSAWKDIFNPPSAEEIGVRLYGLIKTLKEFSEKVRLTDKKTGKLNETGKKVKRTLNGVFAVLKIITTILGGALKVAFKVISSILSYFNLDILDVTAAIGDAAVKVQQWFDSLFDVSGLLDKIVPVIRTAGEMISKWFDAFKNSESLQKAIEYIKSIGTSIKDWWANLKDAEDLPKTIAEGIVNFFSNLPGIISKVCTDIWTAIKGAFSDEVSANPLNGFIDQIRIGLETAGQVLVELGKILLEKLNKFLSAHGFKEISVDAIAGLVNGLKDGAVKVWNAAVELATKLLSKVKEVLGIHSPSTEFAEVGGNIVDGLVQGIQNGVDKIKKTITTVFTKLVEWVKQLDVGAIIATAIGLGIVSASNKIGKALEGFGSIGDGIGDILVNAGDVVKSFSKVLKGIGRQLTAEAIKDFAIALAVLTASIIALAYVCGDDRFNVWEAVGVVAALAGVLIGISAATSALAKSAVTIDKNGAKISNLTNGLIGIGAALLLIALTVRLIGNMDPDAMAQGFKGLAGVVAAIALVLLACKVFVTGDIAGNMDKVGKTIFKISAAMLMLVIVAKLIAGMEWSDMGKATVGLLGLISVVSLLILATDMAGPNADKVGGTILKISVAIAMLVLVAKLIATMEWSEMGKAAVGLLGFAGIIAILILITKIGGNNTNKIAGTILSVSTAITMLAMTAKLLASMKTSDLVKGTICIVLFGGIIAGLLTAVKLAGPNPAKIGLTIIGIAAAVGILAMVTALLGLVKIAHLAKGLIAVGLLSSMVSIMIKSTRGASECKANLIIMAVIIGLLAAAVAGLSMIDATKLATSTLAMATLMGMFALMTKSISGLKNVDYGGLIAMVGVVAVLAGIVILLAYVNVESALANTTALSILILALSASLVIISGVQKCSIGAFVALGLLVVITGLIGLVLGLLSAMNIEVSISTAIALSTLLLAMSAACLIISYVPAKAAISGALGLAAFIGIMAAVVAIAGGLSKIPGFNDLLADGGDTLALIGKALGAFVGSIVSGFAAAVLSILPMFGEALSGFMTGVQPFLEGARQIDNKVLEGVAILAAAILAITVADLLAGIGTLGGVGLVAMGYQLSGFIAAAMPFITEAAKIKPEMVAGVKSLAETILILTAADLIQGLTSFITGGSSMDSFATQLPKLGEGISGFIESIGTFTEQQLSTVDCAAQAIKTLAQASSEIPNSGGLLGQLVGENDLGTFADQFPVLGIGLRGFLDNIGEFTDSEVATVNCAAEAIKSLAQASSKIPNSGGWLGAIVGENDLKMFADQFPSLAIGLRGFIDNVGSFDSTANESVTAAANAVSALAKVSSEIPNSGGWLGGLVGENDLGTFAEQFPKLGEGLSGFVKKLGTFTSEQSTSVTTAVTTIKSLTGLANADLGNATMYLPSFGETLSYFASDLVAFYSSMPTYATASAASTTINTLLNSIKNIQDSNSGCLATFADNLKKISKDAVSKFIEAFTDNSSKTDVKNAAAKLGNEAVDGIKSKKDGMKTAGENLGEGLVLGIDAKQSAVYWAGYRLGQKAVEGEKDGQESNSPSKATIKAGKWLGEGLVIGIGNMSRKVYNAGSDLGKTATNTISSAVAKISDAINTDIDSQPTIRPVLDLSDVRSGVSTIGSMFNGANSLGVQANISSISSMMNSRGQNGTNADVVSAIDRLNKRMDNFGNTTYNVNGVTYDDGSNITEAVRTITRAAVRERRA